MTYETITIETDERGVATLTLNVPERHNAMNKQMIAELADAAEKLGSDDKVRVVVLTGAGQSFCAGGDLGWMKQQFTQTREERIAESLKLAKTLAALNELPKPVIARVNGQAYGGGMGMISVSDVAVGVEGAKFGFTEARLGLLPANIGPYAIARLGEGMARRVFMSARLFGAEEAREMGLLARVVPLESLDEAVEAEIRPYLSCAPAAVAASKRLARALGPTIDETTMRMTAEALADAWETAEGQEGVTAFLEKRKPWWVA